VNHFIAVNPEQLALHATESGGLPISYNLAMTTSGMVILPRRAEGTMLRREDGSEIGFVALNGTTLGGTLMASLLLKAQYRSYTNMHLRCAGQASRRMGHPS
jgi:hypothetical protein